MTIRRVSDLDYLNESDLNKIAKLVDKKENTKTFSRNTDKEAAVLKKELELDGYEVNVAEFKNSYMIYASLPEKIDLREAVASNSFKKLAWGRYCFQRESAMQKYDFDDGSIWRTMTGEDGKEYLVKDVSDDDESEPVRQTKLATGEENLVNENNIKDFVKILYNINDNNIAKDIMASNDSELKNRFYSMLNDKLNNKISHLANNPYVSSNEHVGYIKENIQIAVNKKMINCENELNVLIKQSFNETINKTGKFDKIFD